MSGLFGIASKVAGNLDPANLQALTNAAAASGAGAAPAPGGGGGGDSVAKEQLVMQKDEKFWQSIKDFISKIIKLIKDLWSLFKTLCSGVLQFFRSPPGEYITFIIFIILILVGVTWLIFSDKSPFRKAGGGGSGGGGGGGSDGGILGRANKFVMNLNVDTSWLNKFKGKNGDSIGTVARKTLEEGRCDGVNNIDISVKGSNATNVCLNAKLPVTIEWNIDPTQVSEWKLLPNRVQQQLLKDKGGSAKVYIPWGVMETPVDAANPFARLNRVGNTLVPLCSKAYYTDGSSAAHLFKTDDESPESCKRAIYANKKYASGRTDAYEDTRPTTKTPVNRGENKTCTL